MTTTLQTTSPVIISGTTLSAEDILRMKKAAQAINKERGITDPSLSAKLIYHPKDGSQAAAKASWTPYLAICKLLEKNGVSVDHIQRPTMQSLPRISEMSQRSGNKVSLLILLGEDEKTLISEVGNYKDALELAMCNMQVAMPEGCLWPRV